MAVKTSTLSPVMGLIELHGTIMSETEIFEFRRAINGFMDRHFSRLIIDLSDVTYMNSTMIGVLVSAHTSYTRRKWQLRICGVNRNVAVILAITKLGQVLNISETRDEAIQSLS
jgi:anti-anti-sigma factor